MPKPFAGGSSNPSCVSPRADRKGNGIRDYVELLASVSETVNTVEEVRVSVERGLSMPARQSAERQAVAADLFYRPGGATRRSVEALCELIELEPALLPAAGCEVQCQPSA